MSDVNEFMLHALKRALFVLDSPVIKPLANGAGAVDYVRAAIEAAEAAKADYDVPCHSRTVRKQSELSKAFELVAPKENWKNPIDSLVETGADAELIRDAVVHFTGSVPNIITARSGRMRVQAAGYYATIGA